MTSKLLKYSAIGTVCGLVLSGLESYMSTPRENKPLGPAAGLSTPSLDECADMRIILEKLIPYAEYDETNWSRMVQQANLLCKVWLQASDNTKQVRTSLPVEGHRIHNETKRTFMTFMKTITPQLRATPRLQVMLPSLQEEFLERLEDYVYNIQMAIGDSMLYAK